MKILILLITLIGASMWMCAIAGDEKESESE